MKKPSKPLVLYFTAKWCAPCRVFGPILRKAAREAGVRVVTLDIDKQELLTAKYKVRSLPTLIWVRDRPGAQRLTGAASASVLDTWLKVGAEDAKRP